MNLCALGDCDRRHLAAGVALSCVATTFILFDGRYNISSILGHFPAMFAFPRVRRGDKALTPLESSLSPTIVSTSTTANESPSSPKVVVPTSGTSPASVSLSPLQKLQQQWVACLLGQWVVYESRVMPWDLDLMFHLSNSKYLKECDFARLKCLCAAGVWQSAFRTGTMFVAAATSIRFRRELRLMQKFKIQVRIVGYDDRSVYVEHRFVTEKKMKTTPVGFSNPPSSGTTTDGGEVELHAIVYAKVQLVKKRTTMQLFTWMGIASILPTERKPPAAFQLWLNSLVDASELAKLEPATPHFF